MLFFYNIINKRKNDEKKANFLEDFSKFLANIKLFNCRV